MVHAVQQYLDQPGTKNKEKMKKLLRMVAISYDKTAPSHVDISCHEIANCIHALASGTSWPNSKKTKKTQTWTESSNTSVTNMESIGAKGLEDLWLGGSMRELFPGWVKIGVTMLLSPIKLEDFLRQIWKKCRRRSGVFFVLIELLGMCYPRYWTIVERSMGSSWGEEKEAHEFLTRPNWESVAATTLTESVSNVLVDLAKEERFGSWKGLSKMRTEKEYHHAYTTAPTWQQSVWLWHELNKLRRQLKSSTLSTSSASSAFLTTSLTSSQISSNSASASWHEWATSLVGLASIGINTIDTWEKMGLASQLKKKEGKIMEYDAHRGSCTHLVDGEMLPVLVGTVVTEYTNFLRNLVGTETLSTEVWEQTLGQAPPSATGGLTMASRLAFLLTHLTDSKFGDFRRLVARWLFLYEAPSLFWSKGEEVLIPRGMLRRSACQKEWWGVVCQLICAPTVWDQESWFSPRCAMVQFYNQSTGQQVQMHGMDKRAEDVLANLDGRIDGRFNVTVVEADGTLHKENCPNIVQPNILGLPYVQRPVHNRDTADPPTMWSINRTEGFLRTFFKHYEKTERAKMKAKIKCFGKFHEMSLSWISDCNSKSLLVQMLIEYVARQPYWPHENPTRKVALYSPHTTDYSKEGWVYHVDLTTMKCTKTLLSYPWRLGGLV